MPAIERARLPDDAQDFVTLQNTSITSSRIPIPPRYHNNSDMELQDPSQQLCAGCAQLDLAATFDPERFDSLPPLDMEDMLAENADAGPLVAWARDRWRRAGSPPPDWIRHVGSWTPPGNLSNTKPSCPFCSLVAGMLLAEHWSFWVDHCWELFAFPSHLMYGLADNDGGTSRQVRTSTSLLLLPKEFLVLSNFDEGEQEWKDWLQRMCRTPFRTISLKSEAAPNQHDSSLVSMDTRLLQYNLLDYCLLRSWLDLCAAKHGTKCAHRDRPPVPGLKLIDCEARCIVNTLSDNTYHYVALSYVWGPDPQSHMTTRGCRRTFCSWFQMP
jgi:hypothetical protein